ncbi:response regulator with CheY-like receiver AAA-type ATPase and DNA-binding domains [Candidatus Rickettsiella viridis]|uniref:Response regulator with CheY-like receiver AAA-type ATPase and DNA-binding domains n=1 Tax=Candidatus Rickettsiella viridis TaxID=676208 RepID=A0A2Z5UW49_9COXI|nr:hypothetical protein [Candidatus Rickettsiella viridis]BBB15213.1 response regulator with CheY-like receiver AAA-type ATPase and DNA-binding domains [Candidatus Rickettsiella viridis]
MPRFTLIEVDNFPIYEYIIEMVALPFYLRRGAYTHREEIDFATEAEINEAIADRQLPETTTTPMVVEYENMGDNRRLIYSLTVKSHFLLPFDIRYTNSLNGILLFVDTDQAGRMYSSMLPPEMLVVVLRARANRFEEQQLEIQNVLRELNALEGQQRVAQLPETPPTVNINSAQNTHTASVHQSVTKAIVNLQIRYQDVLDEKNSIDQLKAMLARLKPNALHLDSIIIKGAKQSINTLARIAHEVEGSSGLTVHHIVALIWTAINDKDEEVLLVGKEEALKRLIHNLFEIQRGYNLDEQGNDDGESARPICFGGTINMLVDTLNTIHSDVQIIYATTSSASLKLFALVREHAVGFIKSSAKKIILFEQMKRNKGVDGYPIPEFVLVGIKERVKKIFEEEFKSYLKIQDLNEIFSSYGCVNLTENDFNAIKLSIYTECEEKIALFRRHINNHLSESLKTSDVPQRNKQEIERLNNALNDMLDGLIDVIKKKDELDKDYYRLFKKEFKRLLNENMLFSSSTLEIFRHQILMFLNRLIEILTGKKIASISSGTMLFKQKREIQLSLKDNFEYAINHLPMACSP